MHAVFCTLPCALTEQTLTSIPTKLASWHKTTHRGSSLKTQVGANHFLPQCGMCYDITNNCIPVCHENLTKSPDVPFPPKPQNCRNVWRPRVPYITVYSLLILVSGVNKFKSSPPLLLCFLHFHGYKAHFHVRYS